MTLLLIAGLLAGCVGGGDPPTNATPPEPGLETLGTDPLQATMRQVANASETGPPTVRGRLQLPVDATGVRIDVSWNGSEVPWAELSLCRPGRACGKGDAIGTTAGASPLSLTVTPAGESLVWQIRTVGGLCVEPVFRGTVTYLAGNGSRSGSSEPNGSSRPRAPPPSTPPTVIAVPDTGVNPYHEAFRAGPGDPTFADVPGLPAEAETISLSLDRPTYDGAVQKDAPAWSGVDVGDLVRFRGTRLAGISFGARTEGPLPQILEPAVEDDHDDIRYPILDEDGHGTYTSHAALSAAPHAVVVAIQTPDDENLTEVMHWIADQDWIDLVSVSWGTWVYEHPDGETRMGLPQAYRAAYESGKLIFNGAGNLPFPHVDGEHSGPPFVVAVGGSENDTRGETEIAAKFPDVVAPFTQRVAQPGTIDGYNTLSGTSLGTPYAVGSVAESLWQVRAGANASRVGADPHLVERSGPGALQDCRLTKTELRSAVNRSAVQWTATDWQLRAGVSGLGYGLPVVHPAAQMGWGQITPAVSDTIADLLLGRADPAEKVPGTTAFMETRQRIRRTYWSG